MPGPLFFFFKKCRYLFSSRSAPRPGPFSMQVKPPGDRRAIANGTSWDEHSTMAECGDCLTRAQNSLLSLQSQRQRVLCRRNTFGSFSMATRGKAGMTL